MTLGIVITIGKTRIGGGDADERRSCQRSDSPVLLDQKVGKLEGARRNIYKKTSFVTRRCPGFSLPGMSIVARVSVQLWLSKINPNS